MYVSYFLIPVFLSVERRQGDEQRMWDAEDSLGDFTPKLTMTFQLYRD